MNPTLTTSMILVTKPYSLSSYDYVFKYKTYTFCIISIPQVYTKKVEEVIDIQSYHTLYIIVIEKSLFI